MALSDAVPTVLSVREELPSPRKHADSVPSVRRWAVKSAKTRRRPNMGVVEDRVFSPTIEHARLLERLLASTATDWRTAESLAQETGLDISDVDLALVALGEDVRRPIRPKDNERNWYRLTSRGLTRAEKLRAVLLVLARTSR